MRCQNCQKTGHNKASCKDPKQPKPAAMRPPRAPKPNIGESSKQGERRGATTSCRSKGVSKKNGESSKQSEARGAKGKSKAASSGKSGSNGAVAKSNTPTMNTQEYWQLRDEEAEREVMQEVMEEEERRREELEHIANTYQTWDDVQLDHFSEDELNTPATLSELQAVEEAHIQHNAELPSITEPISMNVSQSEHPTVELPTQPMPDAEIEESQAPPMSQVARQKLRKKLPIRLRNKFERIAKRRKFNFPPDGTGRSPSNPFSI